MLGDFVVLFVARGVFLENRFPDAVEFLTELRAAHPAADGGESSLDVLGSLIGMRCMAVFMYPQRLAVARPFLLQRGGRRVRAGPARQHHGGPHLHAHLAESATCTSWGIVEVPPHVPVHVAVMAHAVLADGPVRVQ